MRDYSEVVYWLALTHGGHLKLSKTKPIIQQWCLEQQRPLAALAALSPLEWSTSFGLSTAEAEQAVTALVNVSQQADKLAGWQAEGIEPLIQTDPRYPARFLATLPATTQPLIVWATGAINHLNEPVVALLGQESSQVVADLLEALAVAGIGLVSGYSRGLDRSAFETSMALTGARALTVLPMGLQAFLHTTTRLNEAIARQKVALISPFAPDTPYQDKLAEARTVLIDHLAWALLIPQADAEAQSRATAALSRDVPVFVGLTNTEHNRALIDLGALLLTDPGEVIEGVQQMLIDSTLQASPLDEPPLPEITVATDDDYGIRVEDVGYIDNDEAFEILSMGGDIPEVLRERLQRSSDPSESEQ